MKVEKFDFRRLYGTWDDSLVGKRVILDNTIDDVLEEVEHDLDKGEILTKGQTDGAPFWSEENGEWYWYAYVLDEDFVGSDLRMVQELNSIVNYHNKNLTKKQYFFLSDLLDYMRSNYESRKV